MFSVLALQEAGVEAMPTAEVTGDALLSVRALPEAGLEVLLSVRALQVAGLEVLPTAEEAGDALLSVLALPVARPGALPTAEETGDALLSVLALPVAGVAALPTAEEIGAALLSVRALQEAEPGVLPTAEKAGDALFSIRALPVAGPGALPTVEETGVRGESEVAVALDGWPGRERYGAERSTIFTEGSIGKNGLRPLRRRTTIETSWPLDARRFALTESTLSIPPELWSPLMQYIIFISAKIMLLFFTTVVRHCLRNHSRELRAFICRLRYGAGACP